MWVAIQDLPRSAAHPFYVLLNQILDRHDFDRCVEGLCERFYSDDGRPGLPPGRYFPLLLILPDHTRAGLRRRDADARRSGADGSQAEEEGIERRLDPSARS